MIASSKIPAIPTCQHAGPPYRMHPVTFVQRTFNIFPSTYIHGHLLSLWSTFNWIHFTRAVIALVFIPKVVNTVVIWKLLVCFISDEPHNGLVLVASQLSYISELQCITTVRQQPSQPWGGKVKRQEGSSWRRWRSLKTCSSNRHKRICLEVFLSYFWSWWLSLQQTCS